MTTIKGYAVWEVPLSENGGKHYIYLRRHREQKRTGGMTLFIANIPGSEDDERALRTIFEPFGSIDCLQVGRLDHDPSTGRRRATFFARISFTSEDSVDRALNAQNVNTTALKKAIEKKFTGGLNSLLQEYRAIRPGRKKIQEWTESVMTDFENAEKRRKQEEEEKMNQVDEDGFRLVAPRGRAARGMTSEAVLERLKKKRKRKSGSTDTPVNFYRFQQREQNRQRVHKLREDFKKDKERVWAIQHGDSKPPA